MIDAVKIILGEPVIISQSTPDIRHWGPYQFPLLDRLKDGQLHCRFHIELDSAKAYGKDNGHAISDDNGKSWKLIEPFSDDGGIELLNGDRILPFNKASVTLKPEEYPAEMICDTICNSNRSPVYEPDYFSYEHSGMYFKRMKPGDTKWIEQRIDIPIPFAKRIMMEGVLPYHNIWRFRLAPDGGLWGIFYPFTYKNKRIYMSPCFIVSYDYGYTWKYLSSIDYEMDRENDKYSALRTGFTEPDIAFLPDGTILCLLRTDDSFHRGPSYSAYSHDQGKTWTTPQIFDDCGVWPTLLVMGNGVTLAGYGRPGLYLRATADQSGRLWDKRITVIAPDGDYENTCAYCDLLPLSSDTAYLVYSYFDQFNEAGKKCKTILGRTVKTEIQRDSADC